MRLWAAGRILHGLGTSGRPRLLPGRIPLILPPAASTGPSCGVRAGRQPQGEKRNTGQAPSPPGPALSTEGGSLSLPSHVSERHLGEKLPERHVCRRGRGAGRPPAAPTRAPSSLPGAGPAARDSGISGLQPCVPPWEEDFAQGHGEGGEPSSSLRSECRKGGGFQPPASQPRELCPHTDTASGPSRWSPSPT